MQSSRLKGLFSVRRSHRRSSCDTQASGTSRQQGNSAAELVISALPGNVEPKMISQDNDTPDTNANEPDVPDLSANQVADISDVGRYRRSRMKRSSKLNRSASVNSTDIPRASLSTCSGSSSGSSDRSLISLDSVDVKSLALAFARSPAAIARSRSETRFGPKARTRLYKRSLRHQSSDSVVVIGSMQQQQENKIARSPSDATMSAASSVEQMAAPKPKTGPHPKKKMLRSHSESAIDVTMLRIVKNNLQDSAGSVTPKSGIVCSNEDLMKILSDARKQKISRRRNNTVICRLDATPELPQELATTEEAETCLNENVAELVRAPTAKKPSPVPITSSPGSWATRHHSMRITNNHTTADLNTQAMDLHGWSPKRSLIAANQNANAAANFPAKMFSRGEKRNSNGFCRNRSYPSTNAQCPTELEPMLGGIESDHDDNGNIVEAEEEEEEEVAEAVGPSTDACPATQSTPNPTMTTDVENQASTSADAAPKTIVCTGFDPELLGQAIERHLSIAKVSPTHENKPERSRSGSIKSLWTQNRISSLVTRFPFRRENSTTAAV